MFWNKKPLEALGENYAEVREMRILGHHPQTYWADRWTITPSGNLLIFYRAGQRVGFVRTDTVDSLQVLHRPPGTELDALMQHT